MAQQILQANFRFHMSRADYEQMCLPMAPQLSQVSGLRWKVWIMNEAESEGGGIYLFDNDQALQSFKVSLADMLNTSTFTEVSIQTFDILTDLTQITRGPIQQTVQI